MNVPDPFRANNRHAHAFRNAFYRRGNAVGRSDGDVGAGGRLHGGHAGFGDGQDGRAGPRDRGPAGAGFISFRRRRCRGSRGIRGPHGPRPAPTQRSIPRLDLLGKAGRTGRQRPMTKRLSREPSPSNPPTSLPRVANGKRARRSPFRSSTTAWSKATRLST